MRPASIRRSIVPAGVTDPGDKNAVAKGSDEDTFVFPGWHFAATG
jgi:hypothetical protein